MRLTIQVLIESADHLPMNVLIKTIDRACESVEEVGLRMEEAKAVLSGLQEQLVRSQLAEHLETRRSCPTCCRSRGIKGYHPLRFRTAFGDVKLRSPRWYRCGCESQPGQSTYSPLNALLTTHTAPELEFLQAKWTAHLSFSAVADLLRDVLPVGQGLHAEGIRQHVFATAERMEAELGPEQFAFNGGCQRDIEASPEPGPPVTVGLDGGYVRGRERRPGGTNCFEVIAGKSIPQEGAAKVFALVRRVDDKPKRRLHEVLASQGVLPRQQVTFLSDGGDTVRELPAFLHPHSEQILDWFHVAMRIEQLLQAARGLREGPQGTESDLTRDEILRQITRAKWYLWHGNVMCADDVLVDLVDRIHYARTDGAILPAQAVLRKLERAITEFNTYIVSNAEGIVNYGERYRCGERISTGFVESTINQVVSKRFVKRQQMRWTPRGAHLLLQTRVRVLNEELRPTFQRWYSKLDPSCHERLAA